MPLSDGTPLEWVLLLFLRYKMLCTNYISNTFGGRCRKRMKRCCGFNFYSFPPEFPVSLTWPFDLRDVCKYQVSKGIYTFSKEFNEAYYDLKSWRLNSPLSLILFPHQLTPDFAIVGEDKSHESRAQAWASISEASNQDDIDLHLNSVMPG